MAPPLLPEKEGQPTYKELNSRVIHTFTFPHYDRCEQAGFHHLSACSASLPDPGWARTSSRPARGLAVADRLYRRQSVRKWRHLFPDATRRGHKNPRASDNMYSRAAIHLIAV
jgi:hypothetical protein